MSAISAAEAGVAKHLQLLFDCAARGEIAIVVLPPGPSELGEISAINAGVVVLVLDDGAWSFGPLGYSPKSLQKLMADVDDVIISAGEPDAVFYNAAVARARNGKRVALIECAQGMDAPWSAFVEVASGRPPFAVAA